MDESEWVAIVKEEGSAFASLLAAADLATQISSCPGWTLADLGRHLGGVHRWAVHAIEHGPSEEPVGPDDALTLRRWFDEGLDDLVRALRESGMQDPCWTFSDSSEVRFWARRQAHETTLHRWDAANSLGQAPRIRESLAEDGIDEVVSMFMPRQLRLKRLQPGLERVELVCPSGRRFILATTDALSHTDATVTGTAEALLLLLWGRVSLDDHRLAVTGDAVAAAKLLSEPLTP